MIQRMPAGLMSSDGHLSGSCPEQLYYNTESSFRKWGQKPENVENIWIKRMAKKEIDTLYRTKKGKEKKCAQYLVCAKSQGLESGPYPVSAIHWFFVLYRSHSLGEGNLETAYVRTALRGSGQPDVRNYCTRIVVADLRYRLGVVPVMRLNCMPK